MVLSEATLIALLALALAVLSVHAAAPVAAPVAAPAPAPTAAAAGISPSLGSVCVAAVVALFFGYGLKI